MDVPPALPTKFPCWCRAVYSWGGETKKDLGFIEGDLIECLNAGDGQWWMGRLRRDKRAVGLFPSNFVKVLDESFVPVSRGSSPMTGSVTSTMPAPKKEKSVFRKPFQAYSAVIPEQKKEVAPAPKPVRPISRANENGVRRESAQREPKMSRTQQLREGPSRRDSNKSYQSGASTRDYSYQITPQHSGRRESSFQYNDDRALSSNGYYSQPQVVRSRQSSYQHSQSPDAYELAYQGHNSSRRASYVPSEREYQQSIEEPRTPSPEPPPPPPQHYSRAAPSPSPAAFDEPDDGPPPPPPPHRVMNGSQTAEPSRAPSPAMNGRYPAISRTPSPAPHSPGGGMTPSPLRDAMDDVLDSLQDMSVDMTSRLESSQESPEQTEPLNPWSPEAFEELRMGPRKKVASRAQTSMGLTHGDAFDDVRNGIDSGYGSQSSADGWKERMESRLGAMKNDPGYSSSSASRSSANLMRPTTSGGPRPVSALDMTDLADDSQRKLRNRKSAYELGKDIIGRKFTTKSVASNATQSTQAQSTISGQSNHTLMSGHSAGAFSATSAGSFARRKFGSLRRANRPMSVAGTRPDMEDYEDAGPDSQMSGPSYHASHPSQQSRPMSAMERPDWTGSIVNSGDPLGGLTKVVPGGAVMPQLKSKRSGFLRKLVDSAKAGAASARNTIGSGSPEKDTRRKSVLGNGVTGISSKSLAEEMGLGGSVDWMQVRRDVNRSNSLSAAERQERQDRCEMMNQPVAAPVDDLSKAAEGEEGLDGMPVIEPTNFKAVNMQLVDKAARFVTNLPPMTNPISLAQGYLCRPYRSDVQRLRAIFTWVGERIAWEEDVDGEIDTRRVIQSRRGCAEEVAILVMEMCQAVGLHAEAINGYLKPPGEVPEIDKMPRPNHWWNAVLVDGEWRIMDCSLASPTNPKRSRYSSSSSQVADGSYFLMRPLEACYTHIPSYVAEQHIIPPVSPDILLALPCACPPFFKHGLHMVDYDTSLLFLSDLEVMHLHIAVPSDVELYAEVETRAYARDLDGDTYESGDVVKKRALAQPEWVDGVKRFTVKALLPGDEGQGRLLVYAGKRGLMHSIKDNPHSLALSLPILHTGQNPKFDFFIRHPTPHAQRHDLYIAQPQCHRLAYGNTFVFAVRQHPSSIPNGTAGSLISPSPAPGSHSGNGMTSPLPFRPGSALSMTSSSASGSNFGPTAGSSAYSSNSSGMGSVGSGSNGSGGGANMPKEKPAKLAVQSPSGKIMRMSRKHGESEGEFGSGTWEAYIKVGERGTWRGLVLADRSARWCVFGEWECV